MDLKKELDICIRSRFALVCIVSHEEERILEEVQQLFEARSNKLYEPEQIYPGRVPHSSRNHDLALVDFVGTSPRAKLVPILYGWTPVSCHP